MWGGPGPGWGGGGGSGGWPNQAAVQAMPHGAVDWAALAQQWIQMKGDGSGPAVGHPSPMTPSFPHQNAPRPPAPEIPRFQAVIETGFSEMETKVDLLVQYQLVD